MSQKASNGNLEDAALKHCIGYRGEEICWHDSGTNAAVAAGPTGSTEAGLEILQADGNAMDAAAATILALSVVDSEEFCFGAEVPVLVYDARRKVVEVISGMGAAPMLATREYFEKAGGIKPDTIEAAAVPAVLDACLMLLERYGTKKFVDVAAPTLRILDLGIQQWQKDLAGTLRRLIDAEKRSIDRLEGLKLVSDYFYRGPIAWEIDAWSRSNGGLIRFKDMATHSTRIEQPVTIDYRGHTVCKCNTWTQGPYLLEALNLLKGFDVQSMGYMSPDTIHLSVEALKLALADRDVYFGDPFFVDVPLKQIISDEYADIRHKLIDMNRASMVQRPGDPIAGQAILAKKPASAGLQSMPQDTTTCVTADYRGNMVAATPSGWQGVLAGSTGIQLGSRLISFNTWLGHPNCIEPGKRPRITLTPTLVLKDNKPVLGISIVGGDVQDQSTLRIVTGYVDFGMMPADLVTSPRFASEHHVGSFNQTPPKLGVLSIQNKFDAKTITQLKSRGHILEIIKEPPSRDTAISIDQKTGLIHVAGNPETNRHAGAF